MNALGIYRSSSGKDSSLALGSNPELDALHFLHHLFLHQVSAEGTFPLRTIQGDLKFQKGSPWLREGYKQIHNRSLHDAVLSNLPSPCG